MSKLTTKQDNEPQEPAVGAAAMRKSPYIGIREHANRFRESDNPNGDRAKFFAEALERIRKQDPDYHE